MTCVHLLCVYVGGRKRPLLHESAGGGSLADRPATLNSLFAGVIADVVFEVLQRVDHGRYAEKEAGHHMVSLLKENTQSMQKIGRSTDKGGQSIQGESGGGLARGWRRNAESG